MYSTHPFVLSQTTYRLRVIEQLVKMLQLRQIQVDYSERILQNISRDFSVGAEGTKSGAERDQIERPLHPDILLLRM